MGTATEDCCWHAMCVCVLQGAFACGLKEICHKCVVTEVWLVRFWSEAACSLIKFFLLNSPLSLSLFFYPFSSFLQEREWDLVFVLRDYNVTCFKIADVLIAVLGAYQKLKLKALCVFPSACLYSFSPSSSSLLKIVLALIQSRDEINSWVDLVENLKRHHNTCDN